MQFGSYNEPGSPGAKQNQQRRNAEIVVGNNIRSMSATIRRWARREAWILCGLCQPSSTAGLFESIDESLPFFIQSRQRKGKKTRLQNQTLNKLENYPRQSTKIDRNAPDRAEKPLQLLELGSMKRFELLKPTKVFVDCMYWCDDREEMTFLFCRLQLFLKHIKSQILSSLIIFNTLMGSRFLLFLLFFVLCCPARPFLPIVAASHRYDEIRSLSLVPVLSN